jgi:hypothetical protein
LNVFAIAEDELTSEQPLPNLPTKEAKNYNNSLIEACDAKELPALSQKNTIRMIKVLDLRPVAFTDKDDNEYYLLGSKETVAKLNKRSNLMMNMVPISNKRRKTYI